MKFSARSFVLWTVGLTVAVIAGLGLLNYYIDPYNIFGNNRLGVYISAERESKATDVQRYPHDALLLGNSKMAMVPASQLQHFRFYNAAFGGGNIEEMYHFLRHFATNQKLVLLAADFGQFDPPRLQGDIFEPPGIKATLDKLISLKSTEYSFSTITYYWVGRPAAMFADGSFNPARWFQFYDVDDNGYRQFQLNTFKKAFDNYKGPPPGGMSFYQKIAELLKARGIACVVFIPPLHEEIAAHMRTSPGWAPYQAWKRELEKIFPMVIDLAASPYGAADCFFKSDPVHFKPETGARFLNELVLPKAVEFVRKNGQPQNAGPVKDKSAAANPRHPPSKDG